MLTNEESRKDDRIDLREIGISEEQAAGLRVKFETFEAGTILRWTFATIYEARVE
jgi:hypothetical protein